MNWVLEHLQILIGAAAAIAYLLNRGRGSADEQQKPSRRSSQGGSDEQAERTRRVQEEIRRKIAERRGQVGGSNEHPSGREVSPPVMPPPRLPPIDPFGGPMRRVVRKIEEAAARLEERPEDPEAAVRTAELARQAKLAERLRELEQARAAEERRTASILSARKPREVVTRKSTSAAEDLRNRLRDPDEFRRAVLLREVLGPPVALR
jgi:hypothetical protein